MAVFTAEQLATIQAAEDSLSLPRSIQGEATNLLVSLRDLHKESLVNGNVDGDAVFAAAVVKWADIKVRLAAAVAAIT